MATALLLCGNRCQYALTTGTDRSRLRVRFAEFQSKIRKPLLELFGQPGTRGKATHEKCELLMSN